jgi:hypothetical protein
MVGVIHAVFARWRVAALGLRTVSGHKQGPLITEFRLGTLLGVARAR